MSETDEGSILVVDDNAESALYDLMVSVLPPNFKHSLALTLGYAAIVLDNEHFSNVVINLSSTGGSSFDFIRRFTGVHPRTKFAVLVPQNFEGFDLLQKSKHLLKIDELERVPGTSTQAEVLLARILFSRVHPKRAEV